MSIPSLSLKDKVAIVTGGRTGIGKTIALAFAEAGADVVVGDAIVEDGQLETVGDEIKKLGRRSMAIQTDITRQSDVESLIQRTLDELGSIDILVNNAGTMVKASLLETTEEVWDKIINTNLKGCYLCCQAAGKRMVEQKSGSIINIASVAGVRPIAYRAAYGTSKAAVIALTKVFAQEVAEYKVRVNAIAPHFVRTEMLAKALKDNPEREHKMVAEIPMGRVSEVGDLIGAALYLASDASLWVTGHTLVVDGGYLAGDFVGAK